MKTGAQRSNLILASKSPRRQNLLEQAGLKFSVIPSSLDEKSMPPSPPESLVRNLAEAKAKEIADAYPDSWVIGADTIVLIDDTILGKPKSRAQARSMLGRLSGKIHRVLTGYCVYCKAGKRFFSGCVKTDVCFKTLTPKEIDWYIDSGEPFDKAGSYAIQGIGSFLVQRINGSYTNVVGLPVCEVMDILIKENVVELTS